MKKLFLNLEVIDGYPPVSMESVWAEVTEEGHFKINNIPFIAKKSLLVILLASYKRKKITYYMIKL